MGKSRGAFHRHKQSERHKESVEKANVLMLNTENNKSKEEKLYSVFKEDSTSQHGLNFAIGQKKYST